MIFVIATTMTACSNLIVYRFPGMIAAGGKKIAEGSVTEGNKLILTGYLSMAMTAFVVVTVFTVVLMAVSRWVAVWRGIQKPHAST
jgi:hypothetical protein